jgi:hypothetical protein
MGNLSSVVPHEIGYQSGMWKGDYESGLESAERVLGGLDAPELRGYRALWHYLAGSAAWLAANAGVPALSARARVQFDGAKSATQGVPWLVRLARYQTPLTKDETADSVLMSQIEKVEAILVRLGTVHDRSFAIKEREILTGLEKETTFEQAHRLLGEIVGFDAGKVEEEGSPDPWWIAGDACLVFEDHAGAKDTSIIDVTKARQVSSHPDWMRANVPASKNTRILAVLVTPVKRVSSKALVHLAGVALWSPDDLRQWANNALATLREVRRTFAEPGDLEWRAKAAELFKQRNLSAHELFEKLERNQAVKLLKPE